MRVFYKSLDVLKVSEFVDVFYSKKSKSVHFYAEDCGEASLVIYNVDENEANDMLRKLAKQGYLDFVEYEEKKDA